LRKINFLRKKGKIASENKELKQKTTVNRVKGQKKRMHVWKKKTIKCLVNIAAIPQEGKRHGTCFAQNRGKKRGPGGVVP